jgi:hypothetical protein
LNPRRKPGFLRCVREVVLNVLRFEECMHVGLQVGHGVLHALGRTPYGS